MRRLRKLFIVSALATTGLVAPLTWSDDALAQPAGCSRDDAKTRYLKGVDLFEEGDYQAALIEFKRSYECVENFNVLYNMGQVYFQLQDYANALDTLQKYLDDGGKRIPQSRRSEVERDVEKLKSRVANVTIKVNELGADIAVDDIKIGKSPMNQPMIVSAGRRKFEASKPGFRSATKVEEIAGQENKLVTLELVPSTTIIQVPGGGGPGPGGTEAPAEPVPVLPILFWSLTGASVITASVMGVLALDADSTLAELKQTPGTDPETLEDQASTAQTFGIVTDVMIGVSIVSAGLATYFTIDFVLSEPEKAPGPSEEKPAGTASLVVGPGSLFLQGTF